MRAIVTMTLVTVLATGIYAGDSGKPEPQAVSDSAVLLLQKLDLSFIQAPLGDLAKFMTDFSQVKAKASADAHDKTVNLEFKNVTLAEALRKIKDQAACDYRIIGGVVHLATPEEWAAIDKGTAKFTEKKDAGAVVAAVGVRATATTTTNATYQIDGVTYTLDELKKKRPELYKTITADPKQQEAAAKHAKLMELYKAMMAEQELLKTDKGSSERATKTIAAYEAALREFEKLQPKK